MATGQLGTAQARGVEGLPLVGKESQGMAWRDIQMAPPDAFTLPPVSAGLQKTPYSQSPWSTLTVAAQLILGKATSPGKGLYFLHDLLLGSGCLVLQPMMAR